MVIFVFGYSFGEWVVEIVVMIGIISVVIECVVIWVKVVDFFIIIIYLDSVLYILIE